MERFRISDERGHEAQTLEVLSSLAQRIESPQLEADGHHDDRRITVHVDERARAWLVEEYSFRLTLDSNCRPSCVDQHSNINIHEPLLMSCGPLENILQSPHRRRNCSPVTNLFLSHYQLETLPGRNLLSVYQSVLFYYALAPTDHCFSHSM
jgi:hypothetical protein